MLISVIIATRNRAQLLKDALQSLFKQERDGAFDFEIIVVDNNSTDDTKEVVARCAAQFNGKLTYLFEPERGKSAAVNHGIKKAAGSVIAFTDDDVDVDKRWLINIAECFQSCRCDCVGGRVLPVYPPNTPRWIKDNAMKLSGSIVIYDYGEETYPYKKPMHEFIGANTAFRKEVFEECGLFRNDLGVGAGLMGEDVEIIDRLYKNKKALYYCGKALVWHPVDLRRMDLRHVAKWNVGLGRFCARQEKNEGQISAFGLGVPRYLFRGVMTDGLYLMLNVFSKKGFYYHWRNFFRKVGMISEYRRLRKGET